MIYSRCPVTENVNGIGRIMRCVMFAGHRRLRRDMHHSFGGLGPFTPGMDPTTYVREGRTIPVPRHLRSTAYGGSQRLGHGKGYKYAHDYEGGFVDQDYLGVDKTYYRPTERGYEAHIAERMRRLREQATAGDEASSTNEPPAEGSNGVQG